MHGLGSVPAKTWVQISRTRGKLGLYVSCMYQNSHHSFAHTPCYTYTHMHTESLQPSQLMRLTSDVLWVDSLCPCSPSLFLGTAGQQDEGAGGNSTASQPLGLGTHWTVCWWCWGEVWPAGSRDFRLYSASAVILTAPSPAIVNLHSLLVQKVSVFNFIHAQSWFKMVLSENSTVLGYVPHQQTLRSSAHFL